MYRGPNLEDATRDAEDIENGIFQSVLYNIGYIFLEDRFYDVAGDSLTSAWTSTAHREHHGESRDVLITENGDEMKPGPE